jgi:chromosome partitioning protein
VNYAYHLASRNRRTLLVDADTQGSIGILLGLQPTHQLRDFSIGGVPLEECVVVPAANLEVLCGGKELVQVESALSGSALASAELGTRLQSATQPYDAVIIDVSPAIDVLQTCAILYARNVVIPVGMDLLNLTGAAAVCEMIKVLNPRSGGNLKVAGLLPCQVDQRLSITKLVYSGIANIADVFQVPVLPAIRTDQAVHRAWQAHRALLEYAPTAKAAQDYVTAFESLTQEIEAGPHEQSET